MSTLLRAIDTNDQVNALRPPPHNYEAERAMLGAVLMNNRAFDRVADFLHADHFADPVNGRVFAAVRTLIEMGRTANPVTLKTHLENDDLIIAAGGIKYLTSLAGAAVTVINAGDYGKLVYDLYLRREMIALAETVINSAFDAQPDEGAVGQIEEAIASLADLLGSDTSTGLVSIGAAITDALERHKRIDRGEITGLSSGLRELDRVLGMMEAGDLIVIAGRPSMGKSALALTILYQVALFFMAEAARAKSKPRQAVFFSQEMTTDEGADRAIAMLTRITAPRRRTGLLDEGQWVKLIKAQGDTRDLPLQIEQRPRATLSHIRTTCRRLQRQGGVGLVVVDYLQIMGIERGRKIENRTQEVGYLATGLKDLAKDLGCPVIVLSQLNRAVEAREDKRPSLADLRESGEIEQAADTVAFCYRDQYYLERAEPKRKPEEATERFHERYHTWETQIAAAHGKAEIIVAKARNGITGTARLEFDGERTCFEDPQQGHLALPRNGSATQSHMPDGRPVPPAEEIR